MPLSDRSSVPTIRIVDSTHEYIIFLTPDRTVESIIRFQSGQRIGTIMRLNDLPWSARWQLDLELQNFTTS